jgi:phosphoribosylglycinamide formyltransferase-1
MKKTKNIAVFASGRGSNFQVILANIRDGVIPARVNLLITNKSDAGAIQTAQENNIPYRVFPAKKFPDAIAYNDAILAELQQHEIDYVVLAGYLKLIGIQIVRAYENRIINIHPALLPSFGGKGMYGHHVHQAVYESGVKYSGPTVHLVNSEYDSGPIVMQQAVPLDDDDTPESIAAKVLRAEHDLFPRAVKMLVEERLEISGRRVSILGEINNHEQ